MQFEILKQNIIDNVLVPGEGGQYVTIGYQRQRDSAEVIKQNRQVTVYFSESEMPKSGGQSYGDVKHNVVFKVELAVVTPAKADLSVLNDSSATDAQRATALRQMSEAGVIADAEMDELIRIVYQTLMDARNNQLGMSPPEDRPRLKQVSSRWIDQISKDTPLPDGEYLMLTASMRLTCSVDETITGIQPVTVPGGAIIDGDIELDGDDVAKQGVKVTTS
jgi:hypothetical protein